MRTKVADPLFLFLYIGVFLALQAGMRETVVK
jgi:hypothetical protein